MTYLTDYQLARVQGHLAVYLDAEKRTGVPWALLAAIHYREAGLADTVARPGGPYQFDPPLTAAQVRGIAARYGVPDLESPETSLRAAAICAGAFLQQKCEAYGEKLLTPGASDDQCARAAWSYNGRAGYHGGHYAGSPYVMNDPEHGVRLWIRGTVLNTDGTRERIDHLDARPGVLAVMRELRARVQVPTRPTAPAAPAPVAIAGVQRLFINGKAVPGTVTRVSVVGDKLYVVYTPARAEVQKGDL